MSNTKTASELLDDAYVTFVNSALDAMKLLDAQLAKAEMPDLDWDMVTERCASKYRDAHSYVVGQVRCTELDIQREKRLHDLLDSLSDPKPNPDMN